MLRPLALAALLLSLASACEKVIDLPLNEADQRIVVEGILKDRANSSQIVISKSAPVYESSAAEKISGAEVTVTDQSGNAYPFTELPEMPGTYRSANFVAQENTAYHLHILVEGAAITALSTTRSSPKIDSMQYTPLPLSLGTSSYLVSYHSVDNESEKNHYRLRIWVNGKESERYYLGDDRFINGQSYEAQFFGTSVGLGDSVFIEMLEMDGAVYDYLLGLSNEAEAVTFLSAAPANPVSNLQGDVLGYFAVFMTDTSSIVVQ